MSEWISVKIKMPSRYDFVLAYCPDDIMKIRMCSLSGVSDAEYFGATHWMPLPEPPKK